VFVTVGVGVKVLVGVGVSVIVGVAVGGTGVSVIVGVAVGVKVGMLFASTTSTATVTFLMTVVAPTISVAEATRE